MTALPKHRPSSRRQNRRRAQQKRDYSIETAVKCKTCGKPKRKGFLCPNCSSEK